MKIGFIISVLCHTMLLSWGLFWLSPPKSFEVADIEALPVDIIPVSSITQIQEGERKAPVAEQAAPAPTTRPDRVEDAQNTGENTVDLKSSRAEDATPETVEAATEPEKAELPTPVPTTQPDAETVPANKPEPVAATEVAALPETQQAVVPDPVAEAIAKAESAKPDFAPLPDNVPTPVARPNPPRAQTAKTPVRKNNQNQSQPTKLASAKESDFNSDEVAALLNRQDPSGGGAKRGTQEAALGGSNTTAGSRLSQSEMDALRGQIQRCWQIVPGMADGADVRVRVTMRLNKSGEIDGAPSVDASGGSEQTRRVLASGARRAVLRCAPYNLPAEKYDTWADVVVNFDPSKMF
jgi:hypothetical protein